MASSSITFVTACILFTATGCGAQMAPNQMEATPHHMTKMEAAVEAVRSDPAWVVNASMALAVPSVDDTLKGLEGTLKQYAAAITSIERQGRGDWAHTNMTIRVDPDGLKPIMEWLRTQGKVTQERVEQEEVTGQLFEREIALKTAKATLARLETLLQKPDIAVDEILSIEKEMTRLRGEIEINEGTQRQLKDQVARATLFLELRHRQQTRFDPNAKFYLMGRGGLLLHGDQSTPGFGFSMHAPEEVAEFHLDADFFPSEGSEPERFLLTVGGSSYSDFFGRGLRNFLNPYLGFRFGYANVEDHHFVFGAEFGLEMFKHRYFLVDARVQGLGIVGKSGLDWIGVAGLGIGTVY